MIAYWDDWLVHNDNQPLNLPLPQNAQLSFNGFDEVLVGMLETLLWLCLCIPEFLSFGAPDLFWKLVWTKSEFVNVVVDKEMKIEPDANYKEFLMVLVTDWYRRQQRWWGWSSTFGLGGSCENCTWSRKGNCIFASRRKCSREHQVLQYPN